MFLNISYSFSQKNMVLILFNRFRMGSDQKENEDNAEDYEADNVDMQKDVSVSFEEDAGESVSDDEVVKSEQLQTDHKHVSLDNDEYEDKTKDEKNSGDDEKEFDEHCVELNDGIEDSDKTEKTSFFSSFKIKIKKGKKNLKFVLDQKKMVKKTILWSGRIFRSLFKLIHFEKLSMDIKVGFEEPALTGALMGLYNSVYYSLDIQGNRQFALNVEPVFDNQDSIEVDGTVALRSSLANLLLPIAVALFTFPYISAFILWLRIRKFRKNTDKI